MTVKKLKCKQCKEFKPAESMRKYPVGKFCSDDCVMGFIQAKRERDTARKLAKAKRDKNGKEKAARSKHRADLKRVRKTPRAESLELAQLLARVSSADDNGYCTCASCGTIKKWNEMDGGHFIAKGDSSYWALDQKNIWPQCKPCNGNGMKYGTAAITYTNWMVDKFGQAFVDEMIATKKTIAKRSAVFYAEFIQVTRKEIDDNKKRIGV